MDRTTFRMPYNNVTNFCTHFIWILIVPSNLHFSRASCWSRPPPVSFLTLVVFHEEYGLYCVSLRSYLHWNVSSSALSLSILLTTMFSVTFTAPAVLIREILDYTPGGNIDNLKWSLSPFSSVPPYKPRDNTSNRVTKFSFYFLLISLFTKYSFAWIYQTEPLPASLNSLNK